MLVWCQNSNSAITSPAHAVEAFFLRKLLQHHDGGWDKSAVLQFNYTNKTKRIMAKLPFCHCVFLVHCTYLLRLKNALMLSSATILCHHTDMKCTTASCLSLVMSCTTGKKASGTIVRVYKALKYGEIFRYRSKLHRDR